MSLSNTSTNFLDLLLVQQSSGNWEKAISTHSLPLSLITAAREASREFKIKLVDLRVFGTEALDPFLSQENLLIGFSVMTGTSIQYTLEAISYIRSRTRSAQILLGGTHPTILPHQTLSSPHVDFVIIGHGEFSLRNLLEMRRKSGPFTPQPLDGFGHKANGSCHISKPARINKEEFNNCQLPAYDLLEMSHYIFNYDGQPSIYIESSRGCNHRCTFCSNSALHNRWVPHSPEYIVRHIEYLISHFSIRSFIFVDLDFFFDLSRIRDFCSLLIKKKLNVTWHSQGIRVQELIRMDQEFFQLLKESGFREFEAIGAESGSQRVVDKLKKNFSVRDLPDLNKRLKLSGIPARYNFMMNVPGETYKDIRASIELALKLNKENPLSSNSLFYIYTPYPGTLLYEEAIACGYLFPDTFEGWSKIQGWDKPLFHKNKSMSNRLQKIHFLSLFTTLHYFKKYFRRYPLLKYVFSFYKPVAIFRLKRDILAFMPEFIIWKIIRRN